MAALCHTKYLLFFFPGGVRICGAVIFSERKIWQKSVTPCTPPHSSSLGSLLVLQHYLLIPFVGETSPLLCQQ